MKIGLIYLIFAVARLDAADVTTRPQLSYSKLIGGSGSDIGTAVATSPSGDIYIAGTTTSLDFPVVNAVQPRIGGTPVRATTDGGKTWSTPAIPEPVYAAAGSAKAPLTIYLGTTRNIYKSVDGGKTWARLAAGNALVNALWVDSATPSLVHAATSQGMLRSDDGGATWRATPSARGNVIALAAHPSRPSTLYAVMGSSLYRSTDSGLNWAPLFNSPPDPFTLTCDAANPDVLYAGVSSAPTSLYRSTNAGESWSRISQPRLPPSTFAIASGPSGLFAATLDGLWRSSDGGASFTPTAIGAATDNVTIDPVQGQNVYASGGMGVWASNDGGVTWAPILPVRQLVETIAVVPTAPPTVFVGADTGRNVFVMKLSPEGKQVRYATYLGGSYFDYATGIAVDRDGNAYVTGYTYSTDFPVTPNAAQAKSGGDYSAFLTKLAPDGKTVLYSTYLGGSASDAAFGIALDSAASVYLTGYAGSADFPVTPGAAQTSLRQNCLSATVNSGDAFVVKTATDGTGVRFATLLGGTCADEGLGVAVDTYGNVYVAGATTSPDFPVTRGSLQSSWSGSLVTGFLAKISAAGNAIGYASFVGGNSSASLTALALDNHENAYVTGTTWGFDQPLYTPNDFITISRPGPDAFRPVPGFPASQGGAAFVAKIDPTGSSRQYLKYLGGTWGKGTSITLDRSDNAWIAGSTASQVSTAYFPTAHPFQARDGGGFITEVAAHGSTLLFSSLAESATQVALDPSGNAFVVGYSYANHAKSSPSALLLRIDGAVSSPLTLEEPRRIVAANSIYRDAGVAPGEIVTLAGDGLGPVEEATAAIAPDGRLATSLAATTVTFQGVPAPLLSVQANRIVCIVPFGAGPAGATVSIQAQRNGAQSNSILFPVASSSIEILTAVNADGSVNSPGHPAAPGSVVTFYGSGFGQTMPPSLDGRINQVNGPKLAGDVGIAVGDVTAPVLFAGPAPGQVSGIVQINFRVPPLPAGSYPALAGWAPVKQGGDYQGVTLWVGP